MTILVYVPVRIYFGPNHWFAAGPVAVQASRVLLYATYFAFGIGVGAMNVGNGLIGRQSALPDQWLVWTVAALIPYAAMWGLIAVKRQVLGNTPHLPVWYEFSYGIAFAIFSAVMLLAMLAIFLRFWSGGWSALDWMQRDAYGIFLVHYVFVLWIQHWLFAVDMHAIAKALIALSGGLALSWATSALLRQIPGAKRVL